MTAQLDEDQHTLIPRQMPRRCTGLSDCAPSLDWSLILAPRMPESKSPEKLLRDFRKVDFSDEASLEDCPIETLLLHSGIKAHLKLGQRAPTSS